MRKRNYHLPTWKRFRETVYLILGSGLLVWEVSDRQTPVRMLVIAAAATLLGIQPAGLLDDYLLHQRQQRQQPETEPEPEDEPAEDVKP